MLVFKTTNINCLVLWLHELLDTNDTADNAPLTFPLSDECLTPRLHVQAQVFHHAVYAVVQRQTAGLWLDSLSADGTLILLFAPLLDAVTTEAMSTVQDDCLRMRKQYNSELFSGTYFSCLCPEAQQREKFWSVLWVFYIQSMYLCSRLIAV